MPEQKDVIIGILGSSGALAGLLLVFSGFIFAQAASFPSQTPNPVINRYTRAARLAIYPFLGFLLITIAATIWLLWPNHCLLVFSVIVFLVLVLWTGIYGVLMSLRYL